MVVVGTAIRLGLVQDNYESVDDERQFKPVLIPQLIDVIDITTSCSCSVALCFSHNVKIINHYQ